MLKGNRKIEIEKKTSTLWLPSFFWEGWINLNQSNYQPKELNIEIRNSSDQAKTNEKKIK